MNLKTVVLTLSAVAFATPAVAQSCKISQSVYRDANGQGFELIFGKPVSGVASSRATAVIKHTKQGELYKFRVGQANGYGSIFLSDLEQTGVAEGKSFVINFFDNNLKSASGVLGRETKVPKYAFINGLGSYDYYSRRASISNDNPVMGDTMWIFNRCQSKAKSGSTK